MPNIWRIHNATGLGVTCPTTEVTQTHIGIIRFYHELGERFTSKEQRPPFSETMVFEVIAAQISHRLEGFKPSQQTFVFIVLLFVPA